VFREAFEPLIRSTKYLCQGLC